MILSFSLIFPSIPPQFTPFSPHVTFLSPVSSPSPRYSCLHSLNPHLAVSLFLIFSFLSPVTPQSSPVTFLRLVSSPSPRHSCLHSLNPRLALPLFSSSRFFSPATPFRHIPQPSFLTSPLSPMPPLPQSPPGSLPFSLSLLSLSLGTFRSFSCPLPPSPSFHHLQLPIYSLHHASPFLLLPSPATFSFLIVLSSLSHTPAIFHSYPTY